MFRSSFLFKRKKNHYTHSHLTNKQTNKETKRKENTNQYTISAPINVFPFYQLIQYFIDHHSYSLLTFTKYPASNVYVWKNILFNFGQKK